MPEHRPPYFGAAYYPEDWPLEQIDQDIAMMKETGMNCMRIGEFAWSRMEPREGHYDFDWLHLVVDKLAAAGIATIMGTPTATPPAWLSEKYPQVLGVTDTGVVKQHGARRHACPNNPVYREHCARIVTKMAREFGQDPNVIGWQIDNEVYPNGVCERGCFCPVCYARFLEALRRKFGDIDALNRAWCTDLWSQTYQSFSQIPPPRSTTWHHPALVLEWMLFQSDSYVEFVHHQGEILHRLARQPVGTDMMPMLGVSYQRMFEKLDVVQHNHYHSTHDLWQAAFWMDYLRPLKNRPFWNTETSTCWGGNVVAMGYMEEGFCRANSWLPFALGGEANLYWLWRTHWAGHELMHGSVISAAGRPMHTYGEVLEVARGLEAAGDFLRGTRPVNSGLAVHFSTHAWYVAQTQPQVKGFNYQGQLINGVIRPMMDAQLRADVIDPAADLSPYRMIVSPFLPMLDESGLRDRLAKWIESGGTWITGPMTDKRNLHAAKFTHAPYGSLEQWGGIYCRYEIPGDPRQFKLRWDYGAESEGSVWYDSMELRGAQALATYTEGPMKGLAAVTRHRMGKGQVVVLGTLPRPPEMRKLLERLAADSQVPPAAQASPNLLVVPREGPAGRGLICIELQNQPATLTLPMPGTDLLSGRQVSGQVAIGAFGVMAVRYG